MYHYSQGDFFRDNIVIRKCFLDPEDNDILSVSRRQGLYCHISRSPWLLISILSSVLPSVPPLCTTYIFVCTSLFIYLRSVFLLSTSPILPYLCLTASHLSLYLPFLYSHDLAYPPLCLNLSISPLYFCLVSCFSRPRPFPLSPPPPLSLFLPRPLLLRLLFIFLSSPLFCA